MRVALCVLAALATPAASLASALDACLEAQGLVRVARVASLDGAATWVRVVAAEGGVPTRVVPFATGDTPLGEALERAATLEETDPTWVLAPEEAASRVCAPFTLSQASLDAEERVVVAAGLNYAAHAEEAGGGEGFLFPKPSAPTSPYGVVAPPEGTALLDYEVELGMVLLEDVSLTDLPDEQTLLARSAFFVANDVTDREPIITHAKLDGTSDGFAQAKGQPGFLPAGPWLVHGPELGRALYACHADGLGLRLEVDEGDGFAARQDATTDLMLQEPLALLEQLARDVAEHGLHSPMPFERDGEVRNYPLALGDDGAPVLPAGSVLLTGTPEGVAIDTPDPAGLVWRGVWHLRGPFEQFRQEQLARVASGEAGGYLAAGDRMRASIDGLGAQTVRIAEHDAPMPDPCSP